MKRPQILFQLFLKIKFLGKHKQLHFMTTYWRIQIGLVISFAISLIVRAKNKKFTSFLSESVVVWAYPSYVSFVVCLHFNKIYWALRNRLGRHVHYVVKQEYCYLQLCQRHLLIHEIIFWWAGWTTFLNDQAFAVPNEKEKVLHVDCLMEMIHKLTF